MSISEVATLGQQALLVALLVSLPVLLAALIVGVLISLLQAVTQIQEMTLTFVPKIVATMIALVVFGPWMMQVLMTFTIHLFQQASRLAR